ncbi:MAG TPA: EamA family transporter [Blastocatellia bacterium]|nr:EamA family transporter [Blastocatellia bacterium]
MHRQKATTTLPPVLFVLFAVLLWSTGGLFIKMTTVDAFAVNCGRSLFAVITIGIFTYRKGLKLSPFTFLTSLLFAGILISFVYATKATTAANAIFLQYTAPIYILMLSPLILKDRFRGIDLLTVVLCLAGMSLFFWDRPNAEDKLAPNMFIGNLVALASGVLFALYFILLRHRRSLESKNAAVSAFYGNLLVVLFMLPFLALHPPQPTSKDVVAILYLGVIQIGIAYILFTYGMAGGVRPFDASIIGFVEPLLNPVWVFLVVGERPSRLAMIGGAIILLTVVAHTLINSRDQLAPAKI